jgi:TRAP-type transport system periplasmic protein
MVDGMRRGTLDGATISALGLDLLNPDVRVFELPLLFASDTDAVHAQEALSSELHERLVGTGVVVLASTSQGGSHLFSTGNPLNTKTAGATRWWVWERDAPMTSMLERAGFQLDHRAVHEVLAGLARGAISGCYGPPSVIRALAWSEHLRFAIDPPLSHGIGMLVISKQSFARLSARDQDALRRVATGIYARIRRDVANDYAETRRSLEAAGVQFVQLPADQLATLQAAAEATRGEHARTPSAKKLLDKVLATRAAATH